MINNKPNVSERTRKLVLDAVKEMGYYGADLTDFLPPQIMDEFEQRMKKIANMKEAQP